MVCGSLKKTHLENFSAIIPVYVTTRGADVELRRKYLHDLPHDLILYASQMNHEGGNPSPSLGLLSRPPLANAPPAWRIHNIPISVNDSAGLLELLARGCMLRDREGLWSFCNPLLGFSPLDEICVVTLAIILRAVERRAKDARDVSWRLKI